MIGQAEQDDDPEAPLDKHARKFYEIGTLQLEELIGDESINADIRAALKEVLKQQNQLSDFKDELKQFIVGKEEVTKEIERITKLLRPASDQGNGLSDVLQKRYESRLIELETRRDGLIEEHEELSEQIKTLEQSLGIKLAPSMKMKNQRQQQTNQGGIF